jgi:carbamoyltransferase
LRSRAKRSSISELLAREYPGVAWSGRSRFVEHHLCHLASAFYLSPFEKAAAVSVDGFGDFASSAWGLGDGAALKVDGRVFFPHSLGVFYQALTQYLGFPNYGDEYKVMGLAPYGAPRHESELAEVLQIKDDGTFALNTAYFRHVRESVAYQWADGAPVFPALYSSKLEELLGPARRPSDPLTDMHRDIARSVQAVYERAFFNLLNAIHDRYRVPDLALAGGCAMNSVANGKIAQRTPFSRVYVQAAAGDAGGAIGAAMVAWASESGATSHMSLGHAYLGPEYTNEQVSALLDGKRDELAKKSCKVEHCADERALFDTTAHAIEKGDVVGWFQGRMEWGPRALGNRSIVCDPRRADMKDILNRKIKRRESFRPFAPSILREHVDAWFEQEADVPFMTHVFRIRGERRALIPAVTHVDGSGRLQTVQKDANHRYYGLISAFHQRTGIPLILNTSFNENEPVVCRPEEALDCFLRTNMDRVVLNDWVVSRA